jgi:hypothetical protein
MTIDHTSITDTEVDDDFDTTTEIAVLPPARPMEMNAIGTLHEHVGAMRDAKFFAEGMCFTQMVPQRFQGKPAEGAAAILFGAELGLSPIASLRSIIVIHGMPGMEARTMKALLKAKGYRFNTIEASDTVFEIEAWSPDGLDHEVSRWTIEDCQREGWVPTPTANSQQRPDVKSDWVTVERNGKTSVVGNLKYITSPRTMLKAKATAEVCRDIAPHVLLGMPYAAEELESFDDTNSAGTPRRVPSTRRGVEGLRAAITPAAVEVVEAEPEPAQPGTDPSTMSETTRRKWLNRMFALLAKADCTDRDDQLQVITHITGRHQDPPQHRDDLTDDQLRAVVNNLHAFDKEGALGGRVTDILNEAALREAADQEAEAEQ